MIQLLILSKTLWYLIIASSVLIVLGVIIFWYYYFKKIIITGTITQVDLVKDDNDCVKVTLDHNGKKVTKYVEIDAKSGLELIGSYVHLEIQRFRGTFASIGFMVQQS